MRRTFAKWFLLAAAVGATACGPSRVEGDPSASVVKQASVTLEPNTIQGTFRFSNQNPAVLSILDAMSPPDVPRWMFVNASSTNPSGFTASTPAQSPSTSIRSFSYLLAVESAANGDAGVTYTLDGRWAKTPTGNGYLYTFQPKTDVLVRPPEVQPNPTVVDVAECTGVIRFTWANDASCATPVRIGNAALDGKDVTFLPDNRGYLLILGGSANPQGTLQYNANGFNYINPQPWSVGCDEIIDICTVIPPAPTTGSVIGPWDVLGETPIGKRFVNLSGGPAGASGADLASTNVRAPLADPTTWWRIDSLPEGAYRTFGSGYIRTGRVFTEFQTDSYYPVSITAGQVTDLSQTANGQTRYPYVMTPAYIQGSVKLWDPYIPLHPGSVSSLQSLFFETDYDANADGVPDTRFFGSGTTLTPMRPYSYLYSNSGSAFSQTTFPGTFDATSGQLASSYEQVLVNAYDSPLFWKQGWLQLGFWTYGPNTVLRPTDPGYNASKLRYGYLVLQQTAQTPQQLNPSDRKTVDHEYCFNEIQLQYVSTTKPFYNPSVLITSGTYSGLDWMGRQANYAVSGRFFGSPAVWDVATSEAITYASQVGSVSFPVPQGNYTLSPVATFVNSDGTINDANFAPIQVSVGCGQRLKLVPPLTVIVNAQATCTASPNVTVTGTVKSSPAQVDTIYYQVDEGPTTTLCTNCGTDPTFSFPVTLATCQHTVKVFGFTAGMPEPASGYQDFVFQDPNGSIACAGSTCGNQPPVAKCQNLVLPANNSCQAPANVNNGSYDPEDGSVNCTQTPSGPFGSGKTNVTLTCTDSKGATSSCAATVTVVDQTAPALTCPGAQTLECSAGGAQASYSPTATDACGGSNVTLSCAAASGSTFPLGTTGVTCTATDAAGNKSQCTFPIQVQDTQNPDITCPPPVSPECTGNGQATVTLVAAASDGCALSNVTGGGTTNYPLGTTPVTFTATDMSGHTATCSTSVTVKDTLAPTITCPAPVVAECTGNGQARVRPNVTATDACSTPTVFGLGDDVFPLGTTPVTYTAADAAGNRASCSTSVTVKDTLPPTITCQPSATVECIKGQGSVPAGLATATDACSPVTLTSSRTLLPLGTTAVTYTATDSTGNKATCTSNVTVQDAPPTVTSAGVGGVWPADHQFRTVTLKDCAITISDKCDGALDLTTAKAALTSVSSDEPRGTTDDILFVDATTVKLRAERTGRGDGRYYKLYFKVQDSAGHVANAVCPAPVPYDPTGKLAVDSGEKYRVYYP